MKPLLVEVFDFLVITAIACFVNWWLGTELNFRFVVGWTAGWIISVFVIRAIKAYKKKNAAH